MRLLRRGVVVVAFTVLASLMLGVGPTAAHSGAQVNHWRDVAQVTDVHDALIVIDNECDGNGVFVEAYDGHNHLWRLWDPNGCYSGEGLATGGWKFWMFRVCENRVGCSEWTAT